MTDQPVTLLHVERQFELAVRSRLDELLRPHGLTTTAYTALTVLQCRAGLTTAELARNSFVTPQAMSDVVATLDRKGLLVRRPDPAHGRRLCTSLTTAGHARLALEDRMLAGLTGEQRAVLRTHLDTCCTALRQM